MEQKQVKLIGLKVLNNGIIQAAELTPDLLKKRLVLITGNIGNGKSTLLNSAKIATSGTDAIKKSDVIPAGFVAEALLLDGETPIYIGAKTDTYKRGEKEGKVKLETYLYTKDSNGKAVQPIIDGQAWTASQYWKALTTELTYSLNDLFSENQTVHRKLIEKLFSAELQELKVDEVVARIEKAKNERDAARTMCQGSGAFMERFEEEGYTEAMLENLKPVDLKAIDEKISEYIIEKDRIEREPEAEYKLRCAKIDSARAEEIQKLKDRRSQIRDEIAKQERVAQEKYFDAQARYQTNIKVKNDLVETYANLRKKLGEFIGYPISEEQRNEQGEVFVYAGDAAQQKMMKGVDYYYRLNMDAMGDLVEPVPEKVDLSSLEAIDKDIETFESSPVEYPKLEPADTTDVDMRICSQKGLRASSEETNRVYQRYQLWRNWIEAKGKYEKEIDVLRKLYASIDTGVPGMKVVPRETESGRVEVWIKYNGEYDPDYFGNPELKHRFMFDYSSFQRTIIGLMLQAARLNLKPRALRIAFVDDVAFTPKDVDVLSDIAEKLDLKLITAWTYDADKENLMDGQVLVEGGEVFFKE